MVYEVFSYSNRMLGDTSADCRNFVIDALGAFNVTTLADWIHRIINLRDRESRRDIGLIKVSVFTNRTTPAVTLNDCPP